MFYFATPLVQTKDKKIFKYSSQRWQRNLNYAQKLRSCGYKIFLPQENQLSDIKDTWENELNAIKNSEGMIILLSDTRGIYLEPGYAYALGKPIYAVLVSETKKLPPWIYNWFEYVAEDIDDLIKYLKGR